MYLLINSIVIVALLNQFLVDGKNILSIKYDSSVGKIDKLNNNSAILPVSNSNIFIINSF